jgi:hypothetical protein
VRPDGALLGFLRAALGVKLLESVAEVFGNAMTSRAPQERRNLRLRARNHLGQLRLRKAGGQDFRYGSLWVHRRIVSAFAIECKHFYH